MSKREWFAVVAADIAMTIVAVFVVLVLISLTGQQ